MRKRFSARCGVALAALLAACSPKPGGSGAVHSGPASGGGAAAFRLDKLNNGIDNQIGGLGTCVILRDTGSGHEVYRYGDAVACMAQLPPCGLFDVPNSLIGLDQGVITPKTVLAWDGKPQPVSLWQKDSDWLTAFRVGDEGWFGRLAAKIGPDQYVRQLRALNFGDHNTAGPPGAFWMGPQAGGALTDDVEQQADFTRRFYAGDLPVKPDVIAMVQAQTLDETRTGPDGVYQVSGRAVSCPSVPDASRTAGWWTGRVKGPRGDWSFAAAVEGQEAPPGMEIERRLKAVFTDAGLLPPAGS